MNIWEAFILGLFGSLHCAGMCGPLVLALPSAGQTRMGYLVGRIAYNTGRLLTYCAIGLVFGLIGRSFVLAGIQRWVSISLGILLLIGLLASRKLAFSFPVIRLVEKLKFLMAGRLRHHSVGSLMILGLLNGLLPCGLVYIAAAAATITGGILPSAAFMLAFGMGTLPMLVAIGLLGRLFPVKLRLKWVKAVPVAVFVLAMLLILRGMSLGIPYVSPVLSHGSCCAK
ncbi:MAG: sulfite exporter TauE/SafE family protein [Limisphaerales bacterium]